MLKRGKTCTHWEWHGGISPEGQGDLPSLVREDWYEESHLIHVSVWLSVSGPAGGMYKWASYYQGRIWGLIKWCDRGLKNITLLPSLNPLPVPPAQSLYFSSLPTFMADENKCGNCLSDLPSWSSQWLFSLSYLVSWKKLSCWHWASLRPKALVALGHYCLRSPVAPVDVVSCRSQTTASLSSARLPTENWKGLYSRLSLPESCSHFTCDSKEMWGWSKCYRAKKHSCASETSGLYQWVSWASSWKTQRNQKVCRAAVGEPQLSPHQPVVSHHM